MDRNQSRHWWHQWWENVNCKRSVARPSLAERCRNWILKYWTHLYIRKIPINICTFDIFCKFLLWIFMKTYVFKAASVLFIFLRHHKPLLERHRLERRFIGWNSTHRPSDWLKDPSQRHIYSPVHYLCTCGFSNYDTESSGHVPVIEFKSLLPFSYFSHISLCHYSTLKYLCVQLIRKDGVKT
jgi:hypothetical protein